MLAVPIETPELGGLEALRASTAGGPPVGTVAIGKAGAINAALLAVAILGNADAGLREKLRTFREDQTAKVLGSRLERLGRRMGDWHQNPRNKFRGRSKSPGYRPTRSVRLSTGVTRGRASRRATAR